MSQGISRTIKRKANELQKTLLEPIIEYNQEYREIESQYGEHRAIYNAICALVDEQGKQELSDKLYDDMILGDMFHLLTKAFPYNPPLENEIDTSGLCIGKTFRDYRELCRAINESPKTGKSKKLQEDTFRRYFDYEKLKHSNEIVILDVYPEPIPRPEQKYKNSKYVNQLKILILCKLLLTEPDKDGNVFLKTTYRQLVQELCLVNKYFYEDTTNFFVDKFKLLFDAKEIKRKTVENKLNKFKYDCYRNIKNAITYSLSRLKTDNLITFEAYNVVVDFNGNHTRATKSDEITIQIAKKSVAAELGYKNSQLASIYQPEKFHQLITKKYHEWDGITFIIHLKSVQIKSFYINTLTNLQQLTIIKCLLNYLTMIEIRIFSNSMTPFVLN